MVVLPSAAEAISWDNSGHGVVKVLFYPWNCHKAQ